MAFSSIAFAVIYFFLNILPSLISKKPAVNIHSENPSEIENSSERATEYNETSSNLKKPFI